MLKKFVLLIVLWGMSALVYNLNNAMMARDGSNGRDVHEMENHSTKTISQIEVKQRDSGKAVVLENLNVPTNERITFNIPSPYNPYGGRYRNSVMMDGDYYDITVEFSDGYIAQWDSKDLYTCGLTIIQEQDNTITADFIPTNEGIYKAKKIVENFLQVPVFLYEKVKKSLATSEN